MTQGITTTNQFAFYDLLRSALLANSEFTKWMDGNDIYELEPKHKSREFKGFPYVWINMGSSESEKIVYDNNFVLKGFEVPMFLRVEWVAHDKVRGLTNAIVAAVEAYESAFKAVGYLDVMIDVMDVNPDQQIDQKELVEVEFMVTCKGTVAR